MNETSRVRLRGLYHHWQSASQTSTPFWGSVNRADTGLREAIRLRCDRRPPHAQEPPFVERVFDDHTACLCHLHRLFRPRSRAVFGTTRRRRFNRQRSLSRRVLSFRSCACQGGAQILIYLDDSLVEASNARLHNSGAAGSVEKADSPIGQCWAVRRKFFVSS